MKTSKEKKNNSQVNYIEKYWHDITSGKIKVSKKIHTQMVKLIELLRKCKEPNSQWEFDLKKGNRPISFIETFCIHVEGELSGKKYKLSLWQKAITQALFGFVNKTTGFRKYTQLHLYVGRKNSKTLWASSLMLYLMFKDGELGAKCYSAATKREQAAISWNVARSIVQKGVLNKYICWTVNGIYVKPYRDSLWQPVSKESKKLDGLNPHAILIDELHAIVDKNMIHVLKDGQKSRKQPLLLITTTMGTDRLATFDDIYERDTNILQNIYPDERTLIFCYELDSESEWDNIEALQKANPNLGMSISIEKLQEEINEVKANPNELINFLCKTCNIRQQNSKAWLPFDVLNNTTKYNLDDFKESIVLGGFDLSRTGDMTAFTTLLFDKKNKKIVAETMYWITKKYFLHAQKKGIPVAEWVKQGLIRISGDELINYHDITSYVLENHVNRGWRYQFINYDSYSAEYIISEFVSMGFAKNHVLISTQQGFKTLSIPMQEMEANLRSKMLSYQDNQVTKWCLTNVELIVDRNGNYMPDKSNYERKIDGVATILNCYVSFCQNKEYFLSEEN